MKSLIDINRFWNIKNIFIGVSAIVIGRHLYKKRDRKIFVSFHSKKDAKYKNLLNAWQKNNDFEFDFHDNSVGVSINTTNEDRIKAGITRNLNKSNLVLCIVGEETYLRPMVNWELEKAQELKKNIIIVKIKYHNKMPECLLGSNVEIINGFKRDEIIKEIYRS